MLTIQLLDRFQAISQPHSRIHKGLRKLLPFKMAMLAEPRRKQKLSINPQGTAWSNDESKFGQKMLEKMGWSKGKGLGAKEDGRVDHVRINLKNDQKGVGCSKNHADNWIAHQDDFNSLLESLNQGHGEEGDNSAKTDKKQVASLEKKSMSSRKRVHYAKFTRGKDLSSRSNSDLKCIFGKREDKKASGENTPTVESAESSGSEESKDANIDNSHGFTTIRSTSNLQEYFAKKMAAMKGQQTSKPEGEPEVKVAEEECLEDAGDVEEEKSKKKKKKKKKKNKDVDVEESVEVTENVNVSVSEERIYKKCKKSKKQLEEDSDMNVTEELDIDDVKKQKKEKKSKKRKKDEEVLIEEENVEETTEVEDQPPKKKKKKKKNRETESTITASQPEIVKKETVQVTVKSPRKKGGRKRTAEVSHVIQTVSKSFRGANVAQIRGYDKLSMSETDMLRRIEDRQKIILDRKN